MYVKFIVHLELHMDKLIEKQLIHFERLCI